MARLSCTVLGLLSLAMGATAGCQQGTGPTADTQVVQIGSTKADLFGLPAEYRALHPRLEACLDQAVRFRAQPDGAGLAQQLEQGHISYAIMSAAEYASIEDPAKLTLLASGVNDSGKTSRKAYLVLKAGSHVKTVADCRGKRFAFGTHGDLLTDIAARRALEEAGVPTKDILLELLPPPLAFEGRLYLKNDTAKTIVNDITVNAGVIDQIAFDKMPQTGGNFITGPSQDQFKIVGQTMPIPEIVVVAGPSADPELTAKLKEYLLTKVKDDQMVCRQLGLQGFAPPDREAYEAVGKLLH